MELNIFAILAIGFSATELTMLASICKLSRARLSLVSNRNLSGFDLLEQNSNVTPHILIVNNEVPNAKKTCERILLQHLNIPVIFISKTASHNVKHGEQYFLIGQHLGAMLKSLLELLDNIAEHLVPKKSCLVIDDSETARTQMGIILDQYTLKVKYAMDAESALEIIKSEVFDIIFLDIMLPNMDGYKACQILKADPQTKVTPVVMLTSKSSPFDKMHGSLVGCDRYLIKPVDANQVYQVLKQYAIL